MARLSSVPGRLRVEATSLIGNKMACLLVDNMMHSCKGVTAATSSHRTGRVLVLFDEGTLRGSVVEEYLIQALQATAVLEGEGVPPALLRSTRVPREASSRGLGHFVMEMALHAFLPAPLDLLLPTAAAFRR